ncbi:MAG: hypothetical protein E2O77_11195 [Caldithrix sp.]|nr:MAG: hypothetical protein E2O77_11195 [Caldithrix sp.]
MKRPNVILISIDTLRADHLSCYGYKRPITPNIDRLAGEGALFTNAYSTAVWTPPAHASMLTGLYPCQHGVVHQNKLRSDIPTVAEHLQRNGYHTAGFVNNSQVGNLVGLNRGHDDFYEVWQGFSKNQIFKRMANKARQFSGSSDHGASETNNLIFRWLKGGWNREKPFYLFIHYIDAHNPLKAPRPFRFKYLTKKMRSQIDMAKIQKVADNPLVCFTDGLELTETEIHALTCLYDEEINYLDYKIGELVDHLKKRNLLEDSLLILTADHGEHLGEHGMYSHVASLYEPIVHIPLILRYPAVVKPETVSHQPVQHIDIFPTILESTDLDKRNSATGTGRSLFKSLEKNAASRTLFAEWEGRIPHFVRDRLNDKNGERIEQKFTNKLWMSRTSDYKLIADSRDQFELYNTKNDPDEQMNLCEKEPTNFTKLRTALESWRDSTTREQTSESYDYSEETLKKHLKALGYL